MQRGCRKRGCARNSRLQVAHTHVASENDRLIQSNIHGDVAYVAAEANSGAAAFGRLNPMTSPDAIRDNAPAARNATR
jgi:hypothetical protein